MDPSHFVSSRRIKGQKGKENRQKYAPTIRRIADKSEPQGRIGLPRHARNEESPTLEERVAKLEAVIFGEGKEVRARIARQKRPALDYSGLTDVKRLKSFLEKSLCILNFLSEKDPSTQGLAPDEIVSILGETFGIQTSIQVVSTQLIRAAGKYVARQKIVGKPIKYRYRILPEGKRYLKVKLSDTRPAAKETD